MYASSVVAVSGVEHVVMLAFSKSQILTLIPATVQVLHETLAIFEYICNVFPTQAKKRLMGTVRCEDVFAVQDAVKDIRRCVKVQNIHSYIYFVELSTCLFFQISQQRGCTGGCRFLFCVGRCFFVGSLWFHVTEQRVPLPNIHQVEQAKWLRTPDCVLHLALLIDD